MIFKFASSLFALAAVTFFSSCASSPNASVEVLPKPTVILPVSSSSSAALNVSRPSGNLVAAASAKPKDRHSMPVYSFSERHRLVRTTAYTCREDDHLIYGSKNATGTPLRYTNRVRSAAADWSFYPVGTTFRIQGLPYLYVIDDYGSALTGTGTIDIYKPNKKVMNQWGRRNVEIQIVQWGSFTRSAELLSQRTKFDHCRGMLANIIRQRPDLQNVAAR